MTHTQWEHGENLTVHNATKEQLKSMVQDEQSRSRRLFEELQQEKEEHKKIFNSFVNLVSYISDYYGLETLKTALEYKGKKDFCFDAPQEKTEILGDTKNDFLF